MHDALPPTECPRCSGTGRLASNGHGIFADGSTVECPDCEKRQCFDTVQCDRCQTALDFSERVTSGRKGDRLCDCCRWDARVEASRPMARTVARQLARAVGSVAIAEAPAVDDVWLATGGAR